MTHQGRLALIALLAAPVLLDAPFSSSAWAITRPTIRLQKSVRANLRGSRTLGSEVLGRTEASWILCKQFRLTPFGEVRRDIDWARWSRLELGTEMGWQPCSWFYVGNGFHQAWRKPGRDQFEWEVRTLFQALLPFLQVRGRPIGIYALNEYTYDLEDGSGIRNEMGAGVKVPLPVPRFNLSALAGWRHVDPIHSGDMDQVEAGVQFEF